MHKGVILLVKAEGRDEAELEATKFLNDQEGRVCDWWMFGGRWSGLLDGYDPEADPKHSELCGLCKGVGFRDDMVGRKAREEDPGYKCNGCRGKGRCASSPTSWDDHEGDILPLTDCLAEVKEYGDPEDIAKVVEKSKLESEKWAERGDLGMQGWCLQRAGALLTQDFCLDTNVFNTHRSDYSIPEDPKGWWACVVDMHS